ncbi:hypothetical protein [Rubrivirga sp.]|uniref:hypothetical protein n=1 Tax=Rubrivirga sp. TaxID=1885344 RepID=UPI003C759277
MRLTLCLALAFAFAPGALAQTPDADRDAFDRAERSLIEGLAEMERFEQMLEEQAPEFDRLRELMEGAAPRLEEQLITPEFEERIADLERSLTEMDEWRRSLEEDGTLEELRRQLEGSLREMDRLR